jgi:hypothetical protein
MNYQCGYLKDTITQYPLHYEVDDYTSFGLRTIIGLAFVAATEFVGKEAFHRILCSFLKEDKNKLKKMKNSVDNVRKNFIDLTTKFATYSCLGFNTLFVVPLIFKYFNIQRDSFYTEI